MTIDNESMRRAIGRWEADVPVGVLLDLRALRLHMLEENGIDMGSWVGLMGSRVVDERKYLIFLLKYA